MDWIRSWHMMGRNCHAWPYLICHHLDKSLVLMHMIRYSNDTICDTCITNSYPFLYKNTELFSFVCTCSLSLSLSLSLSRCIVWNNIIVFWQMCSVSVMSKWFVCLRNISIWNEHSFLAFFGEIIAFNSHQFFMYTRSDT